MKYIIGIGLFIFGLEALILGGIKDYNNNSVWWFTVLAGVVLLCGLVLIINEMINDANNTIIKDILDLKSEVRKLEYKTEEVSRKLGDRKEDSKGHTDRISKLEDRANDLESRVE